MVELNKENFEAEVLKTEGLVLVDFWSDGCEPCKALMPDILALEKQYSKKVKFTKINTTKARRLAIKERVLGLPTVCIYSDGVKVGEVTKDDAKKDKIEEMIKKHL
ncbi:MAG: thioredoxin family protein [Clostridiales bacterium]|nr:thioredoxin family protein [Clostridiales bacterium]